MPSHIAQDTSLAGGEPVNTHRTEFGFLVNVARNPDGTERALVATDKLAPRVDDASTIPTSGYAVNNISLEGGAAVAQPGANTNNAFTKRYFGPETDPHYRAIKAAALNKIMVKFDDTWTDWSGAAGLAYVQWVPVKGEAMLYDFTFNPVGKVNYYNSDGTYVL